MKGTVLRPQRPATAATASAKDQIPGDQRPVEPSGNRITLALLEEHSAQRAKGYDPYNAGATLAKVDAWKQKRKRD